MKTWKQALALVLALVMALSLVALPSFAEGEDDTGTGDGMPRVAYEGGQTEGVSGIYMSKTLKDNGNGQFLLTLEAYVTGTVTTVTQDSPMDIVLVLDVSGSMDDPINKVYKDQLDTSKTYKIASGGDYVEVQYNTSKRNWGYYINYVIDSRWKSVTPKTSENDTNSDNVQFYETTSRLDALQSAVNAFIASAQTMSPSSRIAIVKFASYTNTSYQKTEIVKNLTTLDDNGVSDLQSAVSALYANGATRADIGMQLANNILDSAAKESGNTRRQLAIMFTDGDPTGESGSSFNTTTANSAISNAKNIKDRVVTIPGDNGTTVQSHGTVYTIGCFDTVPSTGSNPDKYMNYVSSNYPSAASLKNPGVAGEKQGYYQTATSADSLKDIFRSISSETGAINGDLKSQTVLQDVISDSFNIDTSDGKAILVHSESCTAIDSTGAPTSWSRDDTVYSYTQEGKTVKVTNFDYKENWVGAMDNKAHGKKIVLEIPIVLTDTATGTVNTNVNETGANSSAIYNDEGKQVADFQSPTVYIPYFTVTHVASTVDSATGANKGVVGASENYPLWCYKEFNLTSVVTRNYLYGGTFNEDTCINVHNDVQEQGNPMKLNPTENATYYIWEVPDTYLRPFGYWISRHLEGGQGTLSVTQLYLLAAVDRVNYADAGLKVSFGNGTSQYISSSCEELSNPNTEQLGSATVYQMLETVKGHAGGEVIDTWYLKNGIPVNYEGPLTKSEETGKYLANDKNNSPIDDGCIIGHRLKGEEFKSFQKSGVTYRPYWVTLDGVRVEGVRSRNYTFVVGSADPGKPSKDDQLPAVYQYLEKQQSAQTLTLRTNLLAGDTEPAVNDLTVTVIDGSNAPQTIKVAPNGSVRDQVAYQAPAGKVFAGWFTDDSFTTPADLDQVTQDTTIYAKYVSDSYLDLDYSRTGLFRLRGVTLISAVDNPANYQVSGFIVGDQKVDVSYASRYRIFKTPANLFGAARDAKLMLADKSLSGAGDLEVTPYWVTLDGTEVHGVTHTLHYNTRTIWE